MIKIEAKIMDVGMGVVVEVVAGSTKDVTARERETADRIIENINQEILNNSNAHKFYERHTDEQQEAPNHRPAHADWVDDALAEIEKAEKEGVAK